MSSRGEGKDKDLLARAKAVVSLAQKHGAQGVRASVSRNRQSRLEWRDGKLERIREHTRLSLGLTLFVDGRYSAHGTSDLRPGALERLVEQTVATTRLLAKDPHRRLPDPERYKGMHTGDLALRDEAGLAAVDPVERRKVARALEEAARSAPGADRIISVSTTAGDGSSESALVTSNGMAGTYRSSSFARVAQVTVKDEGGRKPAGWWYVASRSAADLGSIEAIGRIATRRALAEVGAKPEKSGSYPCIIENVVVGRLLGGLLSPLRGNAIQQERSFLEGKLGKTLGSAALTITDDPLLPGGLASRPYDGEGMAARKRPVFENGTLRTYYLDTYYASKLGKEPTTGGWSNLIFPAGKRDLGGLVQAMDRGILVTGFSGGNSNGATGDFSIGIRGMWIEGGKAVRPVTEMNLAGNHLTFWKQLQELGNDPFESSSVRSPSLRFGEVQFSGMG